MDDAETDDEGGAAWDDAELQRAAAAGDELAAWALAAGPDVNVSGGQLGEAFIGELRRSHVRGGPATDALRWGADELDDTIVYDAAMTAIRLAANDAERWILADGFVAESLATRPALVTRFVNESPTAELRAFLDVLDRDDWSGERDIGETVRWWRPPDRL